MRITTITVCYNEEKILPFFLDYYSSFCDEIIIFDGNSTDNTVSIIQSYARTSKCNIELRISNSPNSVNGYDEEFSNHGYGYEDIDLSHRMNRSKVMCYVPKNKVIYYHFGEPGIGESKALSLPNTKAHLEINDKKKLISCEKGINQWLGNINFTWMSGK